MASISCIISASSGGGTVEYVRVEVTLDHPIAAVWGVVAGFGAIKAWIEGVDSCLLEGDGVGAVRSVSRGGSVTRERLDLLDASTHRISYSLLAPYRLAAKDVRGHIELTPLGAEATSMTWWSEASEINAPITDISAYIEKFYRASIARLQQLLGPSAAHPAAGR
jgi:hypothetical protein